MPTGMRCCLMQCWLIEVACIQAQDSYLFNLKILFEQEIVLPVDVMLNLGERERFSAVTTIQDQKLDFGLI